MKEIEAKILEIDPQEIEQKLMAMGATLSFSGILQAVFYDLPDNGLRSQGAMLRLRREGPQAVLTYKRPVANDDPHLKVLEEKEVRVSDFDETAEILEALGYQRGMENRKHRSQYEVDGVHVVIDDYMGAQSHIPIFMEIEAPTAAALYALAAELGFDKEELKNWNSAELMAYYAPHAGE